MCMDLNIYRSFKCLLKWHPEEENRAHIRTQWTRKEKRCSSSLQILHCVCLCCSPVQWSLKEWCLLFLAFIDFVPHSVRDLLLVLKWWNWEKIGLGWLPLSFLKLQFKFAEISYSNPNHSLTIYSLPQWKRNSQAMFLDLGENWKFQYVLDSNITSVWWFLFKQIPW